MILRHLPGEFSEQSITLAPGVWRVDPDFIEQSRWLRRFANEAFRSDLESLIQDLLPGRQHGPGLAVMNDLGSQPSKA